MKKDQKRKKYSLPDPSPDLERFQRARWKHFVRFFFIGIIVLLFVALTIRSYELHFVYKNGFDVREIVIYLWATIILLPFLPTLVFEADKVELGTDGLRLKNLFYGAHEKWEDIRSFKNPIYLKFAILRGKKGFYLLNKRDLPNFEQLVETIQHKAINIPK